MSSRRSGPERAKSPPKNVPVPPIRFANEKEERKYNGGGRGEMKNGKLKKIKKSSGGGFFSWLFRLFLRLLSYYAIFSALFTCGSHPFRFDYSLKDKRAVCRTLAQTKAQILPIAQPIVREAYTYIDPYAGPYIRAATPVVHSAFKYSKPHYDRAYKHGKKLYGKHVEPARKRAIKRAHVYANPHIKRLKAEYKKQVQPHVDVLHKTVKPYRDIYHRDVSPYVKQAHIQTLAAAYASHHFYVKQLHPRVLILLQHTRLFIVNHLVPAVLRAYELYIQPQQDKITARLFGYTPDRTVKVEKPSPVGSAVRENVQNVAQKVQQTAESVVKKPIEAIKAATENAYETLAETFQPEEEQENSSFIEEGESEEELDRQLDAELEQVTAELASWEKGMGKLIRDEMKDHKKRLRKGSYDQQSIEQARNASIASVGRYWRKAKKAFENVMDDVKFEVTVEDFEGWDKGLGVRVRIFAEDMIELEEEFRKEQQEQETLAEKLENKGSKLAESLEGKSEKEVSEPVEDDLTGSAQSFSDKSSEAEAPVEGQSADQTKEEPSQTSEEETVFSILPIDVIDEKGTPADSIEKESMTVEQEPAYSILPIDNVDEKGVPEKSTEVEEPTFSILPIEVADEKGTPIQEKEKVLHEEL